MNYFKGIITVKIENCNFIKMILMLLIVIYHSTVFWNSNWIPEPVKINSNLIAFFSQWLNSFHIYTFTLVSGYIYYFNRFENSKYKSLRGFIKLKLKRLILPAILTGLIWASTFSFLLWNINFKDVIFHYILAISPNQLWFLWMLFWVFLIFRIFDLLIYKYTITSFILSIIIYFVGIYISIFIDNVFQIWTSFQFIVFFLIGFKLRQFKNISISNTFLISSVVIDIIIFLITYNLSKISFWSRVVSIFAKLLLNLVGSFMAFISLQKLSGLLEHKMNKVFKKLINNSFGIFLFHQQIIYILIIILNGKILPEIHVVINFIVSIIVSIFITNILRKYKVTKQIIGES